MVEPTCQKMSGRYLDEYMPKHANLPLNNANISEALQRSWQLSASNYVQATSTATYRTGWNHYLRFCDSLDIDPNLLKVKEDFPTNPNFSYSTNVLLCFQQSLALFQQLKPETISNYMSGVKFFFNSLFIPTEGFENDVFRRVRQNLQIDYRRVYGLKREKKRLPFTLDMILESRKIISIHNARDHLAFNAMLIGFFLLLRSSELVPTNAKHHLLSQHVTFSFKKNNFVQDIPSHEVQPFKDYGALLGVSILIRSQKNDQEGDGMKYHFKKEEITSTYNIDLSTELLKCAMKHQPSYDHPFLSDSVERVQLSYDHYQQMCKRVAKFCDFDPDLFGTHSVRIGGASTLAAAEVPNHYIQKMGGWRSTTFLDYIRTSLQIVNNSKLLLANKSIFNSQHLKSTM